MARLTCAVALVVSTGASFASRVDAATPKAVNLVASAQVKSAIVVAYERERHIPATELAVLRPGSLYFAYVPSTSRYWVVAAVNPSPHISEKYGAMMQDGTGTALFSRKGNGQWSLVDLFGNPICNSYASAKIPGSVRAVWGPIWESAEGNDCAKGV